MTIHPYDDIMEKVYNDKRVSLLVLVWKLG